MDGICWSWSLLVRVEDFTRLSEEKDFLVRVLGSSVDDLIGWFEGEDMFASATRHEREAVVRGEKVAVCG